MYFHVSLILLRTHICFRKRCNRRIETCTRQCNPCKKKIPENMFYTGNKYNRVPVQNVMLLLMKHKQKPSLRSPTPYLYILKGWTSPVVVLYWVFHAWIVSRRPSFECTFLCSIKQPYMQSNISNTNKGYKISLFMYVYFYVYVNIYLYKYILKTVSSFICLLK